MDQTSPNAAKAPERDDTGASRPGPTLRQPTPRDTTPPVAERPAVLQDWASI